MNRLNALQSSQSGGIDKRSTVLIEHVSNSFTVRCTLHYVLGSTVVNSHFQIVDLCFVLRSDFHSIRAETVLLRYARGRYRCDR